MKDQRKSIKKQRKKELAFLLPILLLLLLGSTIFLIVFHPLPQITTKINISIPETFYVNILNDDNETIDWRSEFYVYRLMISGDIKNEHNSNYSNHLEGDYSDYFIKNFCDEKLLSYYFDIGNETTINNYILSKEPVFNGQTLSYSIIRDIPSSSLGIEAFDLSIMNETLKMDCFDFGNSPFIDLEDGIENNIILKSIDCMKLTNNVYRPYLVLEVNGILVMEKMAWNGTINLESW